MFVYLSWKDERLVSYLTPLTHATNYVWINCVTVCGFLCSCDSFAFFFLLLFLCVIVFVPPATSPSTLLLQVSAFQSSHVHLTCSPFQLVSAAATSFVCHTFLWVNIIGFHAMFWFPHAFFLFCLVRPFTFLRLLWSISILQVHKCSLCKSAFWVRTSYELWPMSFWLDWWANGNNTKVYGFKLKYFT